MTTQIRTHLMFEGHAEQAMNLYVKLFPNSEITQVNHYTEGPLQGKIQFAHFTLGTQNFICIDSPVKHEFTFTPATSIFVDCESKEQLEELFNKLSDAGKILMPLENYGFSQYFGWLQDRFGVSWQLNLP